MEKISALICLMAALAFAEGSVWESTPDFSTSESATLESSASEAPAVESSTLAAPVAKETLPTAKQTAPRIANPKEHRGFYSNFGTGFSYVNFHTEQVDGNDYEEASFKGFTFPFMDFRFGVGVANLLVFYTEFNIAVYSGEANDTEIYCDSYGDCDVDKGSDDNSIMARSYIGFGTSIYPFRDTSSALNGFFLGGSIGYGADAV